MRDNHEGMIELLDAFEKDDHFFAIIKHQERKFQFGISQAGYRAFRRSLQSRPLDMMPGLKYRYFYDCSYKSGETEPHIMEVRAEVGKDATKERVATPKDLHANLLWFRQLENLEDAAYLELK